MADHAGFGLDGVALWHCMHMSIRVRAIGGRGTGGRPKLPWHAGTHPAWMGATWLIRTPFLLTVWFIWFAWQMRHACEATLGARR